MSLSETPRRPRMLTGDVEIKEYLTDVVNNMLDPMRERRVRFSEPGQIEQMIEDETHRVRLQTQDTVQAMRKAWDSPEPGTGCGAGQSEHDRVTSARLPATLVREG